MGASDAEIFSDDLAMDVRDDWHDALAATGDAARASARVIRAHRQVPGEGNEAVVWIALAAAQHETGYLQPDVRDRALQMIETDYGLDVWDEVGSGDERRAVLRRLADKLRGPQPPPADLGQFGDPSPRPARGFTGHWKDILDASGLSEKEFARRIQDPHETLELMRNEARRRGFNLP